MSEKACKTPLTDLLRSVPADTRLVIERSPFHHQTVPIGYLCDEAANEISLLRAELAAAHAAFDIAIGDCPPVPTALIGNCVSVAWAGGFQCAMRRMQDGKRRLLDPCKKDPKS